VTPSLPIRSALAVVVLAVAGAVSGCGPAINNGLTTGSTSTNVASLRFINGSTNAPTVDAYLNATTNLPIASGLIYAQVGSLININIEPNIILLVQKTGTTDNNTTAGDRLGSCALPSLVGGDVYTIVLAGDVNVATGPTAFQCQIFNETTATAPAAVSGNFVVRFHHAAPMIAASGTSTVSYGTFNPNPSPSPASATSTPVPASYNAPLGNAVFTAPTAGVAIGIATAEPAPGVTAAPGVGVYVTNTTTAVPTSVLQYVNPISAQYGLSLINGAGDTSDILPYSTSTTFGVYMLDGAVGRPLVPTLVSTMD